MQTGDCVYSLEAHIIKCVFWHLLKYLKMVIVAAFQSTFYSGICFSEFFFYVTVQLPRITSGINKWLSYSPKWGKSEVKFSAFPCGADPQLFAEEPFCIC